MGYLDFSDAELRALTRQRRGELAARRVIPQPVRLHGRRVRCGVCSCDQMHRVVLRNSQEGRR